MHGASASSLIATSGYFVLDAIAAATLEHDDAWLWLDETTNIAELAVLVARGYVETRAFTTGAPPAYARATSRGLDAPAQHFEAHA
jgi:hypothetical protein